MISLGPVQLPANAIMIVAALVLSASLMIGALSGMEFWRPPGRGLLAFYFFFWIAYGAWLYDIVRGLPFGLTRFYFVPRFLGIAALIIAVWELVTVWQKNRALLEDGYRRCPHCKEVIVRLAVECPFCKEKVTPK